MSEQMLPIYIMEPAADFCRCRARSRRPIALTPPSLSFLTLMPSPPDSASEVRSVGGLIRPRHLDLLLNWKNRSYPLSET